MKLLTKDYAMRAAKSFVLNQEISDDDLIQEIYLAAMEMVGKNYSNLASGLHQKFKKVTKGYYKAKLKLLSKTEEYDIEQWEDQIEDVEFVFDLDKQIEHSYDKYLITAAMQCLDKRERYVIEQYFGFDGEPKTAEEIGTLLGITGSRVLQIRNKAIRKCKWQIGYIKRREERTGKYAI